MALLQKWLPGNKGWYLSLEYCSQSTQSMHKVHNVVASHVFRCACLTAVRFFVFLRVLCGLLISYIEYRELYSKPDRF